MPESIDEKIAAERALVIRCIDSGSSGEQDYHEWRVDKLIEISAHRRLVAESFARASWSGDTEAAALYRDELDRIERGQS